MKPLTILGTVFTATLLLSACDPQRKVREKPAPSGEQKPRPTDKPQGPGSATIDPGNTEEPGTTAKPREDVRIEPKTNIPPPPAPEGKEEYAVKMAGKPGFVTDPHDPQGRPLDVRNMPPGTKIQSPFSGSVLLVPPQ